MSRVGKELGTSSDHEVTKVATTIKTKWVEKQMMDEISLCLKF